VRISPHKPQIHIALSVRERAWTGSRAPHATALETRVLVQVASVVVLLPVTAVAETKTFGFSISGTEVSATSTTGRFVGAASASALGTWYAEVVREPLGGPVNNAS
jgi:hypothetical protein